MERKSFLRSLPYLKEVPSKTWPPTHSTRLQTQKHLEKHTGENDGDSCQSYMPPSKKQRTISKINGNDLKNKQANNNGNKTQHQKRDKVINSFSMLLFPQNKNIALSIEPCVFDDPFNNGLDEGKSSKNEDQNDIISHWVNVGPAFFTINDDRKKIASDLQNQKCMDAEKNNQDDNHSIFSKLEQDPALCLFEAAIVIDSYADISDKIKINPTSLNSPNTAFMKSPKILQPRTMEHGISPGMSSNSTKNNNNNERDNDTPNSTSTISLSQSPISSLKFSKHSLLQSIHSNSIYHQSISNGDMYGCRINSSNTSISLYFRFERKYIFSVDYDQMLEIVNNSMEVKEIQCNSKANNRSSVLQVSKNKAEIHDKIKNPQKPPNMTILFQACLFRIFPLSTVSPESNDSSIRKEIPEERERGKNVSDTNVLNADDKKQINFPMMIEEAYSLMQLVFDAKNDEKKMHTLCYLAVEYKKRKQHLQHQLPKQVRKQNPNICNEGSSDMEPGQIDEQALNHSPQDSDLKDQQLKDAELGDREKEETIQNDIAMKEKERPRVNDIKDMASVPTNSSTKNEIIKNTTLESNKIVSDNEKSEHVLQQESETKINNSYSMLSNNVREKLLQNKRSWQAIQTIFDYYCNFDSIRMMSTSKDDEQDLSKLLTIAAEGLSSSFVYEDMMVLNEQEQNKIKEAGKQPRTPKSHQQKCLKHSADGEVIDYENCENELGEVQGKIDYFLAQLFPAPLLTKNGRKSRHKKNAMKKNIKPSPLRSPFQLNTQVNTPSSMNSGYPSQLSQAETIEQNDLTLEQLFQQYENKLKQKHRLSFLPKRLP